MAWKPLKTFGKGDNPDPAGEGSGKTPPADGAAPRKGWLAGSVNRLKSGLAKTRQKLDTGVKTVLALGRKLDDALIDELEEQLYQADLGPRAVDRLMERIRHAYKMREVQTTEEVREYLKSCLKEDLHHWDCTPRLAAEGVTVILVAGVNGSGKTTSIAKLANLHVKEGRKVLLSAADTFRAAAVEQLSIWAQRVGADIVHNEAADPAAVAYDSADKALAKGYDVLIVDTAGRLHTRQNLMKELEKIRRVLAGKIPGAPHEVILVLDATTGQNAISQATKFKQAIDVTGIFLAKLDGTAKGGIVLGMRDQIDIPVKFVGLGEKAEDLGYFDPDSFVDALFD